MSLFNSYDRDTYLGETNSPKETQGQGVFTPAQQKSLLIQNIFGSGGTLGLPSGVGLGGAVTQATSKATGVTLNTVSGQITMNAAAIAAATQVQFTLTDSAILATDTILVYVIGPTTNAAGYSAAAFVTGAGAATVSLRNNTAGSLSEAVVLQYVILRMPIA